MHLKVRYYPKGEYDGFRESRIHGKGVSNRYKKTAAPKVRQLFILFTAFSDAVVDIGDEGIDVDA